MKNDDEIVFRVLFFRNYNPEEGRGSEKPVSKEKAMEELLEVVQIQRVSFTIPLFIIEISNKFLIVAWLR